mmetsp:Transcript_8214/g.17554  ORF Transcript_8214/g.17554 Transcript_8214/m.17554 type:complete len:92 (-) Transcript_8214:33-308(-)
MSLHCCRVDHGGFGQGCESDGKFARMSIGVRCSALDSESAGRGDDIGVKEMLQCRGGGFGSGCDGDIIDHYDFEMGLKMGTVPSVENYPMD